MWSEYFYFTIYLILWICLLAFGLFCIYHFGVGFIRGIKKALKEHKNI